MFDKDVLLTLFYRKRTEAIKSKQNRSDGAVFNLWLGAACSYRHENPTEFTTITRLCKFFLKDSANAPYGVKQPGNNVFLQTKSK